MQKPIANIITNSNKIDFEFNYNKCKSMEEIDKSLPTLIIGLNNAKNYINNFDILKKEYPEQNLWWTFTKSEKRAIYDIDIVKFNSSVINHLIKQVTYSLIDIVNLTLNDKKKLYKYLLSNDDKMIYNHFNKFLFIYSKKYKKIWGLSLSTLRYFGVNTNKLLSKLYKNKSNKQIYDLNNIPIKVRKLLFNDIDKQLVLNEYFS